jgi:hypothetical protein
MEKFNGNTTIDPNERVDPLKREMFVALLEGAMQVVRLSNVQAWLSFGTLLGHVREGDIIAWDNDVDIMTLAENQKVLQRTFANWATPSWDMHVAYDKTNLPCRLSISNHLLAPGYALDIYFVHPKDIPSEYHAPLLYDKANTTNSHLPRKQRLVYKDNSDYFIHDIESLFPLRRDTFCGVDVYIPRNPESVLVVYYGRNWRIPKKEPTLSGRL